MNLVLLGPPGVGKGTQAERLAKNLNVSHISTGDMFREAISNQTEVGKKAKEYLDSGKLVPDEIVIGILAERLEKPDCEAGFVLDGFPRTIPQAEALDGLLKDRNQPLDAVVYYTADESVVVERLSGRRMCRGCGANFHIKFTPPSSEGICDKCGGELYQRTDDNAETIRERLKVYLESTSALVEFYRKGGLLVEVPAESAPDEVERRTMRALDAVRRKV
jgi:adenylate kinase